MEQSRTSSHRPSLLGSARRHVALVLACALAGLGAGWAAGSGQAVTWTSTARVLVNPTVGNPFAPVPASVRQDELTSLETEAQVAGSAEVLTIVADENPTLTLADIQRGVQVTVPPNTQILELSFTAGDPEIARSVTDSLASAYLDNRVLRGTSVNDERIRKVEEQTETVVDDLRAATAAAQTGSDAQRLFQSELASALRNQLVSLRAQRSYLENSEAPAGSVISGASAPASAGGLMPMVFRIAGALLGLALGCVLAFARERLAGRVRSARDVAAVGLPVAAAVPTKGWLPFRRHASDGADDTVRRLRAHVLGLDPMPEIIAVAPAAPGEPGPAVADALAESIARAGRRVVLVHSGPTLDGKRGMGHALLHKGVRASDLLQPGRDPLMKTVAWALDDDNRDRLSPTNLRSALASVVGSGHLVVLQAPDVTSVEGEAMVGASDLGLVVVTVGRTRTGRLAGLGSRATPGGQGIAAVVLDEATATSRSSHEDEDQDAVDVEAPGDGDEDDRTGSDTTRSSAKGATTQVAKARR